MALGLAWTRAKSSSHGGSSPSFRRLFARYLSRFVACVPALIWFNSTVAELHYINGPSMAPFLNKEYNETLRRDFCLIYKWYAQRDLARGMVVVFHHPQRPESRTVKRVIGLEGDVVQTRLSKFVRVPQGHIWVEGDAGEGMSLDSNDYGPISRRLVIGRITHILLPFSRSGTVRWWDHPERPGLWKAST